MGLFSRLFQQKPPQGVLIGEITVEDLQGISAWQPYFSRIDETDATTISSLQPLLHDVRMLVFVGTWCGDSRREVPHLLGVLRQAQGPLSQLRMIGLDYDRRDPEGQARRWRIEAVPTFILLRNNRELGRIVEHPQESLEQDMLAILSG